MDIPINYTIMLVVLLKVWYIRDIINNDRTDGHGGKGVGGSFVSVFIFVMIIIDHNNNW